jgi:N-acetylglucosaminyl-diphospho-decaprenol L-rhamnosyltransferase
MAAIGILIVTHNSEYEIGNCLEAAAKTGAEILVVDNGSTDGTVGEAAKRGARVIENACNRGFAGAVNQGFEALDAPYVLLLNPDAAIEGSLEPLREACDLPGAAGAGGKLLGSDGRPQIGFMVRAFPTAASMSLEALLLNRVWPNNPVNRRYRGLLLDYSTRLEVDQPAGAFLMIRRDVWRKLGGFDPGFFPIWFDDTDFCKRAVHHGYHWYYIPQSVARHTGAHSISKLPLEIRNVYWYGSFLRYSAKHFRPAAGRVVCLAVIAGSILRMIADFASNRSLKSLAVYGRIVRLASRRLIGGRRDEVGPSGL